MRAMLAHAVVAGLGVFLPAVAQAQWSTAHDQFYLQARHNWEFRDRYQSADRLFNAFDYGHAILYETLWRFPDAPADRLERVEYDRLTNRILVRPPRLPLEEGAIEIAYARLAPEAKVMFEWAHILHRQVYDVWADASIPLAEKDQYIAELLAYYRSRPKAAFSTRPKSMALMQQQPYSLAFRKKYPKFNGLIWAYHWLQVGLYEPLMVGRSPEERQTLVRATVSRFWQMLGDAPSTMPHQMPMTGAISPTFATRYPEIAIIFDNLHSMHDVISDILANPEVPRDRKRDEILLAAERFRDDTSYVMSVEAWRAMTEHMGVHNMGGPSVGFLGALPTPTVTYGAVMTHDDRTGAMTGFLWGGPVGGAGAHAGMRHEQAAAADTVMEHRHDAAEVPPSATDSLEVVRIVERFHRALTEGDSAAALSLLLPDAEILESGGVETRDEYRARHLASDIAFARAVHVERSPIAVTVRGDAAWARSSSTAHGQFRGRAIDSRGVELMVLARTAEGWRIAAIHWSARSGR